MSDNILHIHLFGTFSLEYAGKQINCIRNHSKLIWNILAYLICHREKVVYAEDLISAIWDTSKNANPAGAMRTAIFRARQMLSDLTENPDCRFLLAQNGGYIWNPDIPTALDTDEFEKLAAEIDNSADPTEACLAALELYNGKFLSAQSSELWVMPIQTYYHNLCETVIDRLIPLLEKAGRYRDGINVCRKILQIDPFSEKNHQYLMRFLLMENEREEVIAVYEDMSKLLLSTFGIMPDQESRALYREALYSVKNDRAVSPEIAIEQLCEQEEITGAFLCDYDFFRVLYQAHARAIVRSGAVIHTAVLTLKNRKNTPISPNSLMTAMNNLEKHLGASLRKGDVITRCSSSQFIVMLLSADYENSVKVCGRFTASFEKKYPHSPFYIDCLVRALEPSTQS